MRKCLLAVAAFVTISGSAQANADDESFMLIRTALVTTKKASVLLNTS